MEKRKIHNIRISNQRDIFLNLDNPEHYDQILRIGKALSVPARLHILNILKNTPRSLQEISSILNIPLSSVALHIKFLEEAGLVITENQPGIRGSMRVCLCCFNTFMLTLFNADVDSKDRTVSMEMPIGNYFDCNVWPTCGIANEDGPIGAYDTVNTFYSPMRTRAQLIWFSKGYIEYRFPNILNETLDVDEISFSMELCSEASGFLEDWPSDITIYINDTEVATYLCPGDFGARRGKLTPDVWENGSTQYGFLKTFSVKSDGGYIDGALQTPDISLKDLHLGEGQNISLKIAVKDDAVHLGGVNLFGEKFGDFPQGIIMRITYR
ncbi:MAG: ArsR family transcriptional regulator [Clostridiales bacterium]|nr:ArsR family transcriptional regulator [Clostridiales bacterium]